MSVREPSSGTTKVVIVGGGVAALECAVALRDLAGGHVAVTVVSAVERYVDRPLEIGEPFGLGPTRTYALSAICASIGAELIVDRADAVDALGRKLELASGRIIGYDMLVLAQGASLVPAYDHGVVFDRELSPEDFDDVLEDIDEGFVPRIAFVVPDGVHWTMPAYELAVLTSTRVKAKAPESELLLVTHERRPLQAFGAAASDQVAAVLERHGVTLRTGVSADVVTHTAMRIAGAWTEVDRIVHLPLAVGRAPHGVPTDVEGFIPCDLYGCVEGLEDVYAAGDATAEPIKQGGLAAQQADAVAGHIAARVGAIAEPPPARRVLRGLLRTPSGPLFLRAELHDPDGTSAWATEPLWWPPTKIVSRRLSPHLARLEADRRLGRTGVALAR